MTVTRVTFVSSHARLGGSEVYLETLLAALDRSAVAGVVVLEDGPLVARLEAKGFDVNVIGTSGNPADMARSALTLGRLVRMQGPDVVHANGVKAATMMTLARPLARRPFVWVKHDFSWDGWLGSLVARRAACVVGVSEAVLEGLPIATRSRSSVIPNATSFRPVPREEARSRLERELGCGDRPLVGLVGRFHPVKGHLELVEAARHILGEIPETRFVLIGGEDSSFPDQREVVVRRTEELGVAHAFSFLGHRADLNELLAGLDVGVIPSVVLERGGREGSPFALLEMMIAGVPVVGYDHGGVPEVMGPDGGVLVAPGDRVALADAIVGLLRDHGARESLARAARDRVSDTFSVERMTEEMSAIYASCRGLG